MRHEYCKITPALIHRETRRCLEKAWLWKTAGRQVTVPMLLDVLLLVAATGTSLWSVVQQRLSISCQTVWQSVRLNTTEPESWTAALVRALHDVMSLSRRDRRRRWTVAIDTHYVPYYGTRTAAVVGGPKKHGTKWFHAYATAVLLHRRRRYTVAFAPLRKGQKPHHIVAQLVDQIQSAGLLIRGVALDSAFDSGDTLLWLQERNLAYTVPLRRKGRSRNRRNQCFEGDNGTIRWTEWVTEKTRRTVRTQVVVWKRDSKTMALAFASWNDTGASNAYRQARQARRKYRERFGIETSYRQKNQAQGTTTSRDANYRLLLEGLAHVLRQMWVAFTEQIARVRRCRPSAWIADLTLPILLEWLMAALHENYPPNRLIELSIPARGNSQ